MTRFNILIYAATLWVVLWAWQVGVHWALGRLGGGVDDEEVSRLLEVAGNLVYLAVLAALVSHTLIVMLVEAVMAGWKWGP